MKNFEFDPKSYSKDSIHIGGITTHIYNADSLESHVKQADQRFDIPVNVLYLVHQRGGDYTFTESVAYRILEQFYAKGGKQLICVTLDVRNHGERTVNSVSNHGWGKNNTHAQDMISIIDGNVADLKLLTDFLPTYLDLERYISKVNKAKGVKIQWVNSISGYSLGGHTVIRFASKYPELVKVLNPVVGCPDLSSLLINRLLKEPLDSLSYDKKYFYHDYEELPLSPEQRAQYPEALHKYVAAQDTAIYEDFDMRIRLFSSHGDIDSLVPTKLAKSWLDSYQSTNGTTEVFIQKDVGHDVTAEMVDNFTTWFVKQI